MKPSHRGKPRPKPDHRSRNVTPQAPTGIKPTAAQVQQRIQQCIELLALRRTRSEITDHLCKLHGISWQTVSNYLGRARKLMLERSQRPKHDHIADAFALYENVIKDSSATKKERLAAQMGLNDLLGLNAPKRAEISGPEGAPIAVGEVKVYVPEKRPLVALVNDAVESRGGNGEHSTD